MATVTLTRTFDAAPQDVRNQIEAVGPFMRASGFDSVNVNGETIHLENRVGVITIEMTVKRVDREDVAFAYEHVEGPFDEMETRYDVELADGGARLTAETSFSLAVAVVGDALDGTVIERQRRRELEAQFDWLAERID